MIKPRFFRDRIRKKGGHGGGRDLRSSIQGELDRTRRGPKENS